MEQLTLGEILAILGFIITAGTILFNIGGIKSAIFHSTAQNEKGITSLEKHVAERLDTHERDISKLYDLHEKHVADWHKQ